MRNGHRVVGRIVASVGMVVGLTVGVGAFGAGPARAAQTWVVDQEADETPDPGNQCTAAPGDCSLRQAVDAAVDGDTITIEHLVDPQVTLGQIVVSEDLTIVGEGGATDGEPLEFNPGTRLDAAHGSRIFDIAAGANVTLSDLVLQRGEAPAGEDGGAVRNAGTLRLQRVTVTNSRTTGAGDGGGISSSGSLTLTDVVFAGVIALANTAPNSAGGDGGAIASTGPLSIHRATFDRNTAGGTDGGGAIAVNRGTATIVNATFYGNETARGVGGALHVGGGGQASLVSSTVANNEAAAGGGVGGAGVAVEATWFQDNLPGTCSGSVTAGADTLIWPADPACPATATVAKAWTATATPAAPSGLGATFAPIIRIVEGSPAIDAIPASGGVCGLGAHADQREIARPFGAGCDIGAVEAVEDLFVAFDPNLTAVTRTFADGEERDIPLHAANTGHRTAVGVQVQLTFPAGVTVHSVTPPAGTTYDAGTGIWTVGDILPNGGTEQPLILRLSRNAPGDHVVTAEISSDEPGTAETATLTVHEPVDRYAVVGGPPSGDCLTLATGCAIEYAVELAAQEGETIFLAPGEHVLALAANVQVRDKNIAALDPTVRPTIRGDVAGTFMSLAGRVQITDVDIVNTDAGISTSSGSDVTLERVSARAARRAVFQGNFTVGLTIRDSVVEAVGGSASTQPGHQALSLSAAATVESSTIIGRGTGAVTARTGNQTHTFTNVIARDLGGGIDVAGDVGSATINLTSSNYATVGASGTITPPGTAGNQTAAPAFVDAAGHDFRQATGSPTIDAGTGTPDAERRDIDFSIRAFGASVDIGADEFAPIPRWAPSSHDFGSVNLGSGGFHSFTFTLSNAGPVALTLAAPGIVGPDASQFHVLGNRCGATLDPQASCNVSVSFLPSSTGVKQASLSVDTNAGTATAALLGTVTPRPFEWDGGAGTADRSWHTAANWSTDVVPGATDGATVPVGFDTSTGPVVDRPATVRSLSLSSPLSLDGETLTLGEGASSLAARVSGTGTLVNGGTLSLLAGADWSGPTLQNPGTLLGAGVSSGPTFGPLVNTGLVSTGHRLTIGPVSGVGTYEATSTGEFTFRGDGHLPDGAALSAFRVFVEGRLAVAQTATYHVGDITTLPGGGTLALDGTTVRGRVEVDRGRLEGHGAINGTVQNRGTVAPTGSLEVGTYTTLVGGSVLEIDVSAADFDRLVVTGAADIDTRTSLRVTLGGGYVPAPGDVLRFLQAGGGLTGTFESVTGAEPFSVRYDATGAELFIADTTGPEITATITPAVPNSGWHTTDVTVSWSIVDESEVTSTDGCGDTTVTTDGVVVLTCTATSAGGTSSNSVTIKRDTTAPTVTPTVPTTSAPSGWYLTAPTITFECNDANGEIQTSGVATCPEPVTLDSGAAPQSVHRLARDFAGNVGSATIHKLKVDLVDPTVTCSAAMFTAGQSEAFVSATVTDEHSGPAATTVSAPADTSAVGAFTVSLTGTDVAGRTTTVDCPYTVSDSTGPEITATLDPPTPNGDAGWYRRDVGVTWSVVDPDGPIVTTDGCDPTTVTTDGTTTLTCTATSAGGTSTESVTIRRDATRPTITASVDPAAPNGANGWYVTAPTVTWHCEDATSGIADCSPPETMGSNVPVHAIGSAIDVAGNTRIVHTPESLSVDLVDPTVTCAATAPRFAVGTTGSVSATVEDAHSGPVAGTVSSPAVTTTAGSFTVAVTGTDNAGRTTEVECPYVVERVATRLVADPIVTRSLGGIVTSVRPSAVLTRTDTGAPIAGEPVTLAITRGPSCTAVTDANGRATCGTVIVILNLLGGGTYKASYAGDATYLPSSATGTIP